MNPPTILQQLVILHKTQCTVEYVLGFLEQVVLVYIILGLVIQLEEILQYSLIFKFKMSFSGAGIAKPAPSIIIYS